MSAAAQIVRPGGSIVIASECSDGVPAHGGYGELLRRGVNPDSFLATLFEPGFSIHDQWQVQVQAQIQRKAEVYVKADGLSADQVRDAWLQPISDVGECVQALLESAGPEAKLAVLPQGPQTIPYINASVGRLTGA
jgi:nickel-dependent lactate racemase